ncbi:MAG TPA: cell envelope integrity protein CreD [Caulobacteraceae bacterium]|nr:cell envelope integrity protein CreD [Caulobacteraceae bacterium]
MSERASIPRLPTRSMGLKLLLVCLLALLMSIPALFVFAILMDRTNRAEEVTQELGQLSGGPQTFLGPVLAVPYTATAATADAVPPPPPPRTDATTATAAPMAVPGQPYRGVLIVYPVTGNATASVDSDVRRRSLFKVPIYRTELAFTGTFDLTGAEAMVPGATFDWSRAELVVGASDARGAQADITLTANGQQMLAAPAAHVGDMGLMTQPMEGRRRPMPTAGGLRFFGAPAPFAAPGAKFDAAAHMTFSGAQRLAVLPFAKTTTFGAKGDWADPSFDGGFLPTQRQVSGEGFSAKWSVPFIARGVPAAGAPESISRLGQGSLGVSFVEPANPYQSVSRSLKYAPMFIGLVFLAYFLFESMGTRRVHPAQYVLIGLAQIIFYLLLLALAEQVGFDIAFLLAAGATVALISAYAGWVFESRRQGVIALVSFTALYALIYVLMRLEDLALLVGALTSFAAIAAVMYFTRGIDWYGVRAADAAPPEDRV